MKSLDAVRRIFLDTAPLVYFIEKNERYLAAVRLVFERIDQGLLSAVTSPITLAECLVLPYRKDRAEVPAASWSGSSMPTIPPTSP